MRDCLVFEAADVGYHTFQVWLCKRSVLSLCCFGLQQWTNGGLWCCVCFLLERMLWSLSSRDVRVKRMLVYKVCYYTVKT